MEASDNLVKQEPTGILKVKEPAQSPKTVRIVEPDCIHEIQIARETKRILEKRLLVEDLVERQIEKRKKQFKLWEEEEASHRKWRLIRHLIILFVLLCITLSVVQASVCHSYSPRCGLFWHETIISGVFGCFFTSWNGPAAF